MAFDPLIEERKVELLKKVNFPGQKETVSVTTATVLLITPDEFICANAGDSRTVLSKNKQAIDLSHDHKPGHEDEKARIEKAGLHVDNGRVAGNLAVSRAIGDLFFKRQEDVAPEDQPVSAKPDFEILKRDPTDEFVILACDGLWDCRSSQGLVDLVHEEIYKNKFEDR